MPTSVGDFFRGPVLSGNAAQTYRWHIVYVLLDAAAGGILANAPIIAIKSFQAANWHLPLRELLAGIGMIVALYLGSRMASRPKMPFVFFPGVAAGFCSMAMAMVTGSALGFLTLLGMGALFEITTRPAIAAIVRTNYPVEQRGHATGNLRKWSSLCFLASTLVSAAVLQWASAVAKLDVAEPTLTNLEGVLVWLARHMVPCLMVAAGMLSVASFACFRQIRVEEAPSEPDGAAKGNALGQTMAILRHDGRYRRYLAGCFLDSFFQGLYLPLVWAFLSKDLGFGYVNCMAFMHALPALAAFAATGWLGGWFDRTNPWIAWAWVRFAWGLDALLLAATPLAAALFPPALFLLPGVARLLRGSVQGGWWILWWQIGVTHFAPPGSDTSRYAGIMVFLNGVTRFSASLAGMALAAMALSPQVILVVGGAGVVVSGLYSLYQAGWEKRHHRPETIAEFEHQFAG